MDWLLKFAETQGIQGLYLVAGCLAAKWLADNVAKPLVSAHLDYLSTSKAEARQTNIWLESHAESLKELAESESENSRILERLANSYERLATR